ncbi:MAG: hypothetical protein M3174_02730 [Actinomycetota bacterium]|nr:hypothetical protein [Actinomycetota bacterium]
MSTATVSERARNEVDQTPPRDARVLGHPLAFLATAAILLALFGWTFIANQDRVAPTKDPAYYTWRTETLVSESPETLLGVEGAYEMFSGGHRVAASVLGGYLRGVPYVSSLNTTVLLMVGVPVLTALLAAGFAYRHRRDPLIFHTVAFGVASLYLTPPFVGYLDNVLCLMFLAAALWFIGPARTSWAGRVALFMFLLLAGFTHPTTLVIFCVTLGVVSILRLIFRRFDLRSVVRDDFWMLATAFAAAVTTFLIWQIGLWGRKTSLAEAALPPPYDSDFFVTRLMDWLGEMTPILNGPLLLIGLVGLFIAGRRWVEDDFSVVTFAWLAPLAGLFGFIGGLTYPYYRFLNTTLSWVVLVGLGGYLLIRFVGRRFEGRGTIATVATVAVAVAVGAVFAVNFSRGFASAGWNDPTKGWLSETERNGLDALRVNLLAATTGAEGFKGVEGDVDQVVEEDVPVVFVIDSETEGFQVWGDTKLAGNTSRYGLPAGLVDQGYLYLGSVENFLADKPTFIGDGERPTEECTIEEIGDNTYNCLSFALLEDARAGIERAGTEPIVVVADIFNAAGANTDLVENPDSLGGPTAGGTEVWTVTGETVTVDGASFSPTTNEEEGAGALHIVRVLACLALLLLPGLLAIRFFLPDVTFGEAVAMVPALALALLTLVAIVVLAVTQAPFNSLMTWICLAVTLLLSTVLGLRGGRPGAARSVRSEP